MPLQNVYSLPSIGRFVVKLAEKRQKTALKFQLRFCEGRFYPILDMKTVDMKSQKTVAPLAGSVSSSFERVVHPSRG